jgi:NTE family protein
LKLQRGGVPRTTGYREKTALVLSAGGVFGAYQAGVWKALADSFQPDLVVGASIGSINGWLIASGCDPRELEALWLQADEVLAVKPKLPRRWSQGFLNGQSIENRLSDLCSRYSPRVEYGVVLTDLRRLKPRCFTGETLGYRHLLASCAVLGAFDLQRLEGALYTDGGLMGALPLWAAESLGATRIIAVNVMPRAPLPVRLAIGASRAASRGCPAPEPVVETVNIAPEKPLGSFFELLRYRRTRIREWIDLGYRDALEIKHSMAKCFEG